MKAAGSACLTLGLTCCRLAGIVDYLVAPEKGLGTLGGIRKRFTYANVVASLALFIALGGSSYAAVQLSKNSVRSKHIKNGQVKRADLGGSAVDSTKVKDGSLLSADFKAGQLPAGLPGPPAPRARPE